MSPRVYDANVGRHVEVYESEEELSVRAGGRLIYAAGSELAIQLTEDEKHAEAVTLTLQMLRSEAGKMAESDKIALEVMDLVKFDPMLPMTFVFDGSADLVKGLNHHLDAGKPLEKVATMMDGSGFPVFFDIDNYKMRGYFQKGHQPSPADTVH